MIAGHRQFSKAMIAEVQPDNISDFENKMSTGSIAGHRQFSKAMIAEVQPDNISDFENKMSTGSIAGHRQFSKAMIAEVQPEDEDALFSRVWLNISDFEYQMSTIDGPANYFNAILVALNALNRAESIPNKEKSKQRDLTILFLNTTIQYLGSWNRTFFSSLAVVISTVKRNGAAYLPSTLRKLGEQIASDSVNAENTVVLVVDHSIGGPSEVSRSLEEEFSRRHPGLFHFDYNDENSYKAMKEFAGVSVQRQALCIVNTLSKIYGRSYEVLIMEDDFLLCPGALRLIHCILHRVSAGRKTWIAMRISYGMNGILIRNQDIPKIIIFLILNMWHKPSDHNIVEWFLGETGDGRPTGTNPRQRRPYFVYRYNLMSHIGSVSSFGHSKRDTPICFDTMDGRVGLRKFEAFNASRGCSRSELSPCWGDETSEDSSYSIAERC
jgi:hypothetical protein